MFTYGFTLHVKRPGGTDAFGAKLPGTEHDVPGCAAAPAGSTEVMFGQVTVRDLDTVYAPFDADVNPTDTVVVPNGQPIPAGTYQVDGSPQRWHNPLTGRQAGCVIHLANPDAAAS